MTKPVSNSEAEQLQKEWKQVRQSLSQFPDHFFPQQVVEMLDACTHSILLQKLVPYISLGRLCLSRNGLGTDYTNDCPCIYYHNNLYTASSYDNEVKYFFQTAQQAINFVERNIPLKGKE